ncbi:MAG: hypothetical protein BWX84_02915 [Verrucomicrobia bacterium ADurb.Bin118]|nr:MAG: hypothetical protein BWX84_02915 [Verrucomicrobia bacterium ADurb.Bin118]
MKSTILKWRPLFWFETSLSQTAFNNGQPSQAFRIGGIPRSTPTPLRRDAHLCRQEDLLFPLWMCRAIGRKQRQQKRAGTPPRRECLLQLFPATDRRKQSRSAKLRSAPGMKSRSPQPSVLRRHLALMQHEIRLHPVPKTLGFLIKWAAPQGAAQTKAEAPDPAIARDRITGFVRARWGIDR